MKMVLTNQNIVEAHEVTQINTAGQLTFTATIKSDVDEKIETTDIVFVKVKDDRYRPYKIVQSNMPTPNTIQYTCIEYAYYLFAKDGLVHDKRPTKLSVAETITQIIMGTKWKVGYTDPNLPTFTGNFYWQTRTDCFKELVEGTGSELEFYMTMSNNKITSRTIEAYKQRGTDTHQRFTYGMNALEVIAEEDATNAVTKVYPRGSGEMYTSDGEGQRKLTISDVEWSKAKGDPTDKPKGQDYLVYGSAKYDLDNGNQPSAIVEFQNEKDANNLIRKAFNWLKQNNRPKVQFKAKVSDVGDLKLGDRVVIDREDLGIKYVTRVFKLDRNLLNEKLNTIELGDVVAHTLADAISNVSSSLADTNKRVDNVSNTIVDGNGNTVTYGPNEPTTKKKGDTWYKPGDIVDGIQQYDVYVWDGEKWVLTIGNQLQNELLSKVEQAQKDTEEAKQQAQQASDKADQIVIDFNKRIGDIQTDINGAKEDAASALSDAQKAIQQADFNNQEITKIEKQQSDDGKRLTVVETNYNGLNQTVTDLNAKTESYHVQLSDQISDVVQNQNSISQRVQTAEGTIESIENMTGSNTIVNTVKGQQQQIQDASGNALNALKTAQGVQTTVSNMRFGGTNLFPDGSFENGTYNSNTVFPVNNDKANVKVVSPGYNDKYCLNIAVNRNVDTGILFRIPNWNTIYKENTSYTFSLDLKAPEDCELVLGGYWQGWSGIASKFVTLKANVWQRVYLSATTRTGKPDNWGFAVLRKGNKSVPSNFQIDNVQIEEGNIATSYAPAPQDFATTSQLTQTADLIRGQVSDLEKNTTGRLDVMSNNINAKVDKDGLITQINISPGNVLIDGQKVHITGQTTIDNAVITSSMIKDVNADKITAGTLNAANVKIVNLDVNTLGGDYATFLKTAWKDSNSYSEITADGMKFFQQAGDVFKKDAYLNVYASRLKWTTSNKAWHYIQQTTDKKYRNSLTIGGFTNDDPVAAASVNIRTDGYDVMTTVKQSAHYGGKYVFVGSLDCPRWSDGVAEARGALFRSKETNGSIEYPPTYAVSIAADNDISLGLTTGGTTDAKPGRGIRFCASGGLSNETLETRIVMNDTGVAMVIKSIPTYNRTYSGSANMFITNNGYIGRSTSAKKYKQDIEYIDNINEAKKTLDIHPAEWADKKVMESRARARATGNELTESLRRRYIGFIADDFADAGFEKLILRDDKGEVEEFQYDRLSVYHHQMIKDLYNQIDVLKNEIKKLKGDN